MRRSSDDVPPELSNVPPQALEGYVRRRLLALANMPCVARSLNSPSEVICQALIQAMEMGHLERVDSEPGQPGSAEWQLVFRHECLNLGCLDAVCCLCMENPNRRCTGNFADKYLAGDVLKATCGAPIRVELMHRSTGDTPSNQDYKDIILEMYILDGKAFAALQESGQHNSEAAVDECMLLANNQGKVLLATDRNGEHNRSGMVLVPVHATGGHAMLPGLNVTGSSEALLSGQKPPFRLLCRATSKATGARLSNIKFAVSEPFVVATQRTRTASKALIPSLTDPVGKLNGLGGMTVKKLIDLGNQVREARSAILADVPMASASTVEEFKVLIQWAEEVPQRVEELKKVLRLNQNYQEARDHAMQAVGKDCRLRYWTNANISHAGALFPASLGSVDCDHPAVLLEREGATVKATLPTYLTCHQKETLRRVQNEARKAWWRDGHPGWGIWDYMSEEGLVKNVHSQDSDDGCVRLPAEMFPEGVLNPVPRNTHSFGGFPSLSDKGSSGFMGLNSLRNPSGGPFSRPNILFSSAQPQLRFSQNPPAAAMPSTLWPQRFGAPGSGHNMFMPSIPEPEQPAAPSQNGHSMLKDARDSDLMPSLGQDVVPSASESLLKPSFRRDRPPPPSPFAEEEPQSSDNTNSASLGPDYRSDYRTDYTSMKQPLLSEALSEGDRHREKRANVQAGQLQQKMSTLMGRPLGEAELRTIFPSFSAQMPGSAFSGLPHDVSLAAPIQQQQAQPEAQQQSEAGQAPAHSASGPPASNTNGEPHRWQEGSAGVSNPELKISLSPVDIPDLDLDDFVNFLNNGRELDPDESATLKTLFSGRLDSPLPSISSRQGSALQTGFSYGRLLHSRGSGSGGMGNSRPSSGLDNMSTLEEAMNGGTSKRE